MTVAPPPVPKRKPVFAVIPEDTFRDFVEEQEENIKHMYRDTAGKATVGIGRMIPDENTARNMPFYHFEGNDKPLRRATPDEISRNYRELMSQPFENMRATTFDPLDENSRQSLNLRLRDESINGLFRESYDRTVRDVRDVRPDFAGLPDKAQLGLMDMSYNLGRTKFNRAEWPNLFDAIDRNDWTAAGRESHRKGVHEKRNDDVRKLFEEAGD